MSMRSGPCSTRVRAAALKKRAERAKPQHLFGQEGLTRQLREDLPEGQVGIAHPGLRVAIAVRDDDVGILLACPPAELGQERGLPCAGLSGHEADRPLPRQGIPENVLELSEFALPCEARLPG